MTTIFDQHDAAGWRIRRFGDADREDCQYVFYTCTRAFTWLRGPQAPIQTFRAPSKRETWVAEVDGGGCVGFLTLDLSRAHVDYLLVDPDWRLCGVGSGLLRAVRQLVDRPLTLTVDMENTRARAAYAAMGWTPVHARSEGERNIILMSSD